MSLFEKLGINNGTDQKKDKWRSFLGSLAEQPLAPTAAVNSPLMTEGMPAPVNPAPIAAPMMHEAGNIQPSISPDWQELIKQFGQTLADNPQLPSVTAGPTLQPRFGNSASQTENDFPTNALTAAVEMSPQQQLEAARRQRETSAGVPVVDNDKGKGFLHKLGVVGREALIGAGQAYRMNPQGGLGNIVGGAVGGAGGYALNPTADEQRTKDYDLFRQDQNIGRMEKGVEFGNAQALKQAQTNTITKDDLRLDAKNQMDATYRDEEQRRKSAKDAQDVKEYEADSKHKRATLLANTIGRLPSFDPNDPRNADIVKEMKALGFPVVAKDAKKNVKYIQDEKTGAWFTSIVDTATGKEETRPITSGGKQLVTTPRAVVQGDYANQRTEAQQQGANQRTQTQQAGANQRSAEGLRVREQLGQKTAGMKASQLLPLLQKHAQSKFKTLEQAKEDFKAAGIKVDDILSNQ